MHLKIVLFNQHWFHLCAAAEAVVNQKNLIESLELIFVRKGLKTWPLDAHFPSQFKSVKKFSPEYKLFLYLQDCLRDQKVPVTFTAAKIRKTKKVDLSSLVFEDFSKLRKFKAGDHPVGMAIASYLISRTKSSSPKPSKYKKLIPRLFSTYFQIQDYLLTKIEPNNTDEVWLCNGRQLHERSVVEFCKSTNIPFKFFEIGGDGNSLERWILHEHSPHDRVEFQREIEALWNANYKTDMGSLETWFENKLDPKSNPFTSKQVKNLDSGIVDKFVVFYTSSDDEVAAISEDWDSPWGSQIDAARMLIDAFQDIEEIKLIIRVHPNILNKNQTDQMLWRNLNSNKNVLIIAPESRVDSYSLMNSSQGVLTYGSTMGVEAAYWGKPLGLLSRARYDELVENSYLDSIEKVRTWVDSASNQILPKPKKLGALKWANYFLYAGEPWQETRVEDRGRRKIGYLGLHKMRPNNVVVFMSRCLNRLHSG